MAYTEFCCRSGGSNLNAGTRNGNSTEPGTAAALTYASGNWVAATGVFTVASGDPVADGVAVGDFASVYANGSTVTGFVGRVTARTTTTITVSLTAKAGTAPTDGTGNRTLKIGGAWQGPNGTSGFPFNFVASTLTNSSGDLPRVNCKNDATYSITANINNINGNVTIQGYSSSYGDLGRATLDGGTSGAAYTLIGSTVGSYSSIVDFIFQNNGASGSAVGIFWNSASGSVVRCRITAIRGSGGQSNNNGTIWDECEFDQTNQQNSASNAGLVNAGAGYLVNRCIFHDQNGSQTPGAKALGVGTYKDCIFDTNNLDGLVLTVASLVYGCDFYNNGGDGIECNIFAAIGLIIENCNFIKNAGYGINFTGSPGARNGRIVNCGFGSGTQANTSGNTNAIGSIELVGSVTYPSNSHPYTDPANGDFRIALAEAKHAGRGAFTQLASSYSGTVSYPDIGAAQHQATGGGVGSSPALSMSF